MSNETRIFITQSDLKDKKQKYVNHIKSHLVGLSYKNIIAKIGDEGKYEIALRKANYI